MSVKTWFIATMGRKLRGDPGASRFKRRVGSLFRRYFPGQLTCAQFERFVFDYVEGTLAARERARFEFHMRICPMCEVHFRSYVKAVEMGREICRADQRDAPMPLPDDLLAAVLDARREEE